MNKKFNANKEYYEQYLQAKAKYKEILKGVSVKSVFKDILFLILPVILTIGTFFILAYTFMIGVLFLYLIFPMYYCFYVRISYTVTHFGEKNYNYVKAYKDYFSGKGKIFRWIVASFSFVSVFYLLDFFFTRYVFGALLNHMYPVISDDINKFIESNPSATFEIMTNYWIQLYNSDIGEITQVLSLSNGIPIYLATIFPLVILIKNMFDHFACSYVFPGSSFLLGSRGRQRGSLLIKDIDKNINMRFMWYHVVILVLMYSVSYALGMYFLTLFKIPYVQVMEFIPLSIAFFVLSMCLPAFLVFGFSNVLSSFTYLSKDKKLITEISQYFAFQPKDSPFDDMGPFCNFITKEEFENNFEGVSQNFSQMFNEFMSSFGLGKTPNDEDINNFYESAFNKKSDVNKEDEPNKEETNYTSEGDIGGTIFDLDESTNKEDSSNSENNSVSSDVEIVDVEVVDDSKNDNK